LWFARGKIQELVHQIGVQKISAFGVDLQFAERQTTAAYTERGLSPPSQEDKAAIEDAMRFLAPLAAQTRVLWVDERPGGNNLERTVFLSLEVDVQAARTTDDALDELKDPSNGSISSSRIGGVQTTRQMNRQDSSCSSACASLNSSSR
jgi:hypothetical protein